MPAPTSGFYDDAKARALKATSDLTAATLRVMLLKDTYVFDATHKFVADVVAAECNFTAYVRKVPANRAVSVAANVAKATFDPVAWLLAGGVLDNTIAWVVLFTLVTNDADSLLITAIPVTPVVTDGTTATFTPNAAGVVTTG